MKLKSPAYIAQHIRRVLKDGGSAPHAEETQRFFKEKVATRGWRTAELRKVAQRFRRVLLAEHGPDYLLAVADQLFRGSIIEEKAMAVELLAASAPHCGEAEFCLFESWLERVGNWAEHDGLVHTLIGPMMLAYPPRAACTAAWANSSNLWMRRAAAVALIRGVRQGLFAAETARVTSLLLDDQDLMVQKGLGWLLREAAKYQREAAVDLLLRIRFVAPRLVLRTACETLPPADRARLLNPARAAAARG
ncbi:MAG TPA: DNA alkylation repair protein [Terriglobales bacterium]|nr:DNA alkylation repair protein [Terriglobales bacterium]